MPDDNVINLAEHSDSALHWSPLQAAEFVVSELKKEQEVPPQKFVAVIYNEDGSYRHIMAGTSNFDVIALMELVKLSILKDLGYQ